MVGSLGYFLMKTNYTNQPAVSTKFITICMYDVALCTRVYISQQGSLLLFMVTCRYLVTRDQSSVRVLSLRVL